MRAAVAAANDPLLRKCKAWPNPLDQRLDLHLSQAAKHLEPGDQLFSSQAEVERAHVVGSTPAHSGVLAFQRAIELSAQQTFVVQLPEQRHLELERGLAEENLLEARGVIGILQTQSIERPGGCGEPRAQHLLQAARNRIAQDRAQAPPVESQELLERKSTHQQGLEPH